MKKIYLLLVSLIVLSSCVKNKDYILNDGLAADSLLRFVSISDTNVAADSNSQIVVRLAVYDKSDNAEDIILTTNLGIINGRSNAETAKVTMPRYVDFVLTSGTTPGVVTLSASIYDSLKRDTIVYFSKSYPDTILIKPENTTISNATTTDVDIYLVKSKGYPSKNQVIYLEATDTLGNTSGDFKTEDAYVPGQKLVAQYTPDSNYTGKVKLKVLVMKEDNTSLEWHDFINVE